MTIDQFNNMKFYHGMKVKYDGKVYPIDALDFQEMLIGITETDEEEAPIAWKRCENCELVTDFSPSKDSVL